MKNIFLIVFMFYFNNNYGQYYLGELVEGKSKFKSADYKGAVIAYNEVIKSTFNNTAIYDVYFLRAEAKIKLKDFTGAINDYTKALEYNRMLYIHEAYYNRGIAKNKLGDYKGASLDYQEAIRQFPFVEVKGWTKSNGEYTSEVYSLTIKSISDKITSDAKNGELYHFRGIANLESDNISDACSDFCKAIELGFKGAGSFIDVYCK